MPVVYNTVAASCPAIPTPALLDPATGTPAVFPSFTVAMDPVTMITGLQSAMVRIEAMGQRGGGLYGILAGLDFADGGGLTLRVNDGAAAIDAYVNRVTAGGYGTVALTNGTAQPNYIWMSQAGGLTPTLTTTAPAGKWVYLGNAVVTGGAIVSFDMSGVLTKAQGGMWERRTADSGVPGDTPPASVRFIQHSLDGDYSWNGTTYQRMNTGAAGLIANPLPVGQALTVPAGYDMLALSRYTVNGTLVVNGRLKILDFGA